LANRKRRIISHDVFGNLLHSDKKLIEVLVLGNGIALQQIHHVLFN
jgi:hypothetical protein